MGTVTLQPNLVAYLKGTVTLKFSADQYPKKNSKQSVRICLSIRDPVDADKDKWETINFFINSFDDKMIWNNRYNYPVKSADVNQFCNSLTSTTVGSGFGFDHGWENLA